MIIIYTWTSFAQRWNRRCPFHFADFLEPVFRRYFESLPRQRAFCQVNVHMAESFQVVATTLFYKIIIPIVSCALYFEILQYRKEKNHNTFSEVSVYTHVSSRTCKTLFITERYMFFRFWINILFGQSKIYLVHTFIVLRFYTTTI